MRACLAWLALAACSAPPASPPQNRRVDVAAPTGPAPRIGWSNATFDTSSLPAVARAGDLVVIAASDGDAGRGFPNLRVEIRERNDRLVDTVGVMTSNEFETLAPDGTTAGPELERRIAAVNRRLADLHAQHDLVAMRTFAAGTAFDRAAAVEGDGLVVTFAADNQLRVRTRDGKTLATTNGTAWLAPAGQRCPQCPPCENPAFLKAFYKAERIDVAVVRITYTGTDTCWEPGDQLHVVGW